MTLHLRPSNSPGAPQASFREKPDGSTDPAGETGWFLQRERERLGKTLADAALETGINAKYLNALEYGELGELPSRSYALGYVRVYAEYLGLDPDPMVEHYRGLLPTQDAGIARAKKGGLSSVVGLIAASLAFLAGLTATVWFLAPGALRGGGQETVQQTVPNPAATTAAEQINTDPLSTGALPPQGIPQTPDQTAELEAQELDQALPTVRIKRRGLSDNDDQGAIVPGPSVDSLNAGDRSTLNETMPAGEDQTSGLTEFIRQHVTEAVAPEDVKTQSPSGTVYGIENLKSRIVLRATQPVWIRVEDATGNILITRTLTAGDSYRVPDRKGLVLIARDGGALDYSIDGRPKGTIGASGEIIVGRLLDLDRLSKAGG